MRTPEQQKWIDEAIKRGIVPGATIRDVDGEVGVVPEVDSWGLSIIGIRNDRACIAFDRPSGPSITIRSAVNEAWATVITPAPPSMNDRVKDVLSRHPGAKEALKELFPDAFPEEPFEFGKEFAINIPSVRRPLYIGNTYAPSGLRSKCLIVGEGYEMRTQEHDGRTVLTFHKKR